MPLIYRVPLALLFLLIATAPLLAQDVIIRLHQPPPNQLKVADLWRVDLTNMTKEQITVYLRGVVTEERDGRVVEARTASFKLAPGFTTVTAAQISPIKVLSSNKKYEAIVTQTGGVPSGSYTICVTAHARGDEEIGNDCIEQSVELASPPVLLSPGDEDEVDLSGLLFTWAAPSPLPKGVSYTIRIVEIIGKQSPYDAMQKNRPTHERADIATPIYKYTPMGKELREGTRYAWRVVATMGKRAIGESEVWQFIYRPAQIAGGNQTPPKGGNPGDQLGLGDDRVQRPTTPDRVGLPGDIGAADSGSLRRILCAQNWGFELGTLDCWTRTSSGREGGAEIRNSFSEQPVTIPPPPSGRGPQGEGQYWVRSRSVSSLYGASLTSQPFTIGTKYIHFLMGGLVSPQLRVDLFVGPGSDPRAWRRVRTATNAQPAYSATQRIYWPVEDLRGQTGHIMIVDSSRTSGDFIIVDDFNFSDVLPGNWDFEEGLSNWLAYGNAFTNQPIRGAVVPVERARPPGFDPAGARAIGGDYWNTRYDIGHHANHWIGTGDSPGGSAIAAEAQTGTLTSLEFRISTRYITMLLAGSNNSGARIELQIDSTSALDYYRRLAEGAARTEDLRWREEATAEELAAGRPASSTSTARIPDRLRRDGEYVVMNSSTGSGREILQRSSWDVSNLQGARARIRIVDDSPTAHINVDDIQFVDTLRMRDYYVGTPGGAIRRDSLRDAVPGVWGFGDFHAHPMTHLGFGGLFHGEPAGPVETALRDCDGVHHGTALRMPVPRALTDLRILLKIFIPFGFLIDMDLPGEDAPLSGSIDVSKLVLQAMEHNHDDAGHIADGSRTYNGSIRFVGDWDRIVERGWPNPMSVSHQQMYRDWLYRAYQGGMRVMCALVLNNELLSVAAGRRQRDADILTPQVDYMKAMARDNSSWMEIAYTAADARRIVASNKMAVVLGVELDHLADFFPETGSIDTKVEAMLDRLTREGVRHIFPVHLTDNIFSGYDLNKDLLHLSNYYMNGAFSQVRDGTPFNVTYRAFDGLPGRDEHLRVSIDHGVEFYGNPTYRPGSSMTPRGGATLIDMTSEAIYAMIANVAADETFRRWVQSTFRLDPVRAVNDLGTAMNDYSRHRCHVNARGLTEEGRVMMNALMRRGLLIDIDHMSALATDTALNILERNNYPIISGHNDYRSIHRSHRHEGQHSDEQLARIGRLGGVSGSVANIGNDVIGAEFCQGTSWSWLKGYEYAVAHVEGAGVGIGTDFNGFLGGPAPRFGPQACQSRPFENAGDVTMHHGVLYSHYSTATIAYPEDNYSVMVPIPTTRTLTSSYVAAFRYQPPMTACRTGDRTFDYNTDGLAHVGLLPDMMQDCKNIGMRPESLRVFMGSAEAFIKLWEKCEARSREFARTGGPRR